jgi:hypothetical protein
MRPLLLPEMLLVVRTLTALLGAARPLTPAVDHPDPQRRRPRRGHRHRRDRNGRADADRLRRPAGYPVTFWVPDASQGANATAATFLTTVPKIGTVGDVV